MKKSIASCFFVLLTMGAMAQVQRQTDTTFYKALISADRVKLLQNMDVIANMQYSMNNYFTDGKYEKSTYALNQFRFEIKGKVHEKVYYRFRNRYTRAQDPQSVDKISNSVDLAFIRLDATPQWNFTFGKMCADWGGYEFDLNPIDIYEYNDIVEYADNFLTGMQAQFVASPKHIFTAQILNSRTKKFEELYDSIPGVTEARFPVAAVLNWRGNFRNGKFTTLWSYSRFLEAQNKSMFYIALGNMYNFKKGSITYDFKWSYEQIDRKGIISDLIPDNLYPYRAQNAEYREHWLQLQYRFAPKWNAALIGMVSQAFWNDNPDNSPNKDNLLRTSWGVIPTIEFYPFKDLNLRFFATHVARMYRFSDYAKQRGGAENYNTGRVMLGFITPLLIL